MCIYFTDGYGSFPKTPPETPVLWVVVPGGLESIRFPFGEVARMQSQMMKCCRRALVDRADGYEVID